MLRGTGCLAEGKLVELCPGAKEKFKEWNKAEVPAASDHFPPISEKEARNAVSPQPNSVDARIESVSDQRSI